MATATLTSTALLYAASTEATYAAAREGGNGRYVSEFGWIGQYYGGGPFEVNQVFARFDLSSLPANALITSAKLIVTARESYGNHTVEVRSSAFTPGNATSFVPGSGLAAKTLLGTTDFAPGFDFERQIVLSGYTRENLASLVLAGAAQRTGTAPTGDTTTRVTAATLEVTYVIAVYLTTPGAGSWSLPTGVTSISIECWGGGGGGTAGGGATGGGGAYASRTLNVAAGSTIPYSVGAGGTAGSQSGNPSATNGGDTWFGSTSTLMAKGGGRGNSSGGQASASFGVTKFSGGSGYIYDGVTQGQPVGGGSATKLSNGAKPAAGTGGAQVAGASNVEGGAGGVDQGQNGGAPGGGGALGYGGAAGAGARGQIRITYEPAGAPPADTTPPTITSAATASIAENTANPTGTLTANETVTWSKNGGADAPLFSLSGSTWTLNATPDFETKATYTVVWRAVDAAGNGTNQTFTLNITDVVETPTDTTAPTITSSASPSVAENTVGATGTLTANELVTWTKVGGADASAFALSGSTWTLSVTPDYETKTSFVVIWRATDAAGNTTDQTMTLAVTDVVETPPASEFKTVLLTSGSGTYTFPAEALEIVKVECWGGGAASNPSQSAGGGGAYSAEVNIPMPGNRAFNYSITTGGTALGQGGGDTWFGGGGWWDSIVLARGGQVWGQPGFAADGRGSILYSGGQSDGDAYGGTAGGKGGGGSASPQGNGLNATNVNAYGAEGGNSPGAGLGGIGGTPSTFGQPGQDHVDGGGGGGGNAGSNPGPSARGGDPGGGGAHAGEGAVTRGGRGQIRITYKIAATAPAGRLKRSFFWF